MTIQLSRSEMKRRAKAIETLAQELTKLSSTDIDKLDCVADLKNDLKDARSLKGGARKRLIKYIAKSLRETDPEPLFQFLEDQKGSKLKKAKEFHELEHLRDAIVGEVFSAMELSHEREQPVESIFQGDTVKDAVEILPDLDVRAVKKSALAFAKTRKPVHKKEIFRHLNAAFEIKQFKERKE